VRASGFYRPFDQQGDEFRVVQPGESSGSDALLSRQDKKAKLFTGGDTRLGDGTSDPDKGRGNENVREHGRNGYAAVRRAEEKLDTDFPVGLVGGIERPVGKYRDAGTDEVFGYIPLPVEAARFGRYQHPIRNHALPAGEVT